MCALRKLLARPHKPVSPPAIAASPRRRISSRTGTAEYFDAASGTWVPWREWSGK